MREEIVSKLREIEESECIRIIYAIESGSRAWGFESENSDYDVRFIYLRPYSSYLSIVQTKDTLEFPINNNLDMSGWDFKKTLQLLYKSNPSLFEWLNSPITYIETPFVDTLRNTSLSYFNRRSSMLHYISMADNNYRLIQKEQDNVTLKRYFYCIRPILCCKWIIENKTIPPVKFIELTHLLDKELLPIVEELIENKKEQKEKARIRKIDKLNSYIEKSISDINNNISSLPTEIYDYVKLDELFIKALKEYGGLND